MTNQFNVLACIMGEAEFPEAVAVDTALVNTATYDHNGTERCPRCGGTGKVGHYHIANGICFLCGGTGKI